MWRIPSVHALLLLMRTSMSIALEKLRRHPSRHVQHMMPPATLTRTMTDVFRADATSRRVATNAGIVAYTTCNTCQAHHYADSNLEPGVYYRSHTGILCEA